MAVTVKPVVTWHQDDGPDPSWRYAVLDVEGAAPGLWRVRNSAPGWHLHLYHNGHHIGMTHWNAWDAVAALIEHESGPYTVTIKDAVDDSSATVTGNTLTQARLVAYRAEKFPSATATVTNPDGNEVRWPRRDNPKD